MTFKELVIAIVNIGHSELVMNAAKQAGASKGTLISAEAFSNSEMATVVEIPEKEKREVILIVCDSLCKEDVLRTINDAVSLDSTGAGMVFSIPLEKYIEIDNE